MRLVDSSIWLQYWTVQIQNVSIITESSIDGSEVKVGEESRDLRKEEVIFFYYFNKITKEQGLEQKTRKAILPLSPS